LDDEGPAEGSGEDTVAEQEVWVDVDLFREAALEIRRTREPAAYRAALNL
jgi:hypothetical protein